MSQINLERKRLFPGFDGKTCKVDPKIMTDGETMILTYTKLLLTGSDVFFPSVFSLTGGICWAILKKTSVRR